MRKTVFERASRRLNAFKAPLHPRTHRPELPGNCVETGATSVVEAVELTFELLLNRLSQSLKFSHPSSLSCYLLYQPNGCKDRAGNFIHGRQTQPLMVGRQGLSRIIRTGPLFCLSCLLFLRCLSSSLHLRASLSSIFICHSISPLCVRSQTRDGKGVFITNRSDIEETTFNLPRGGKRSIIFLGNETLYRLLAYIEVRFEYIRSEQTQGHLNIVALPKNGPIYIGISDGYICKCAPQHLQVQLCP